MAPKPYSSYIDSLQCKFDRLGAFILALVQFIRPSAHSQAPLSQRHSCRYLCKYFEKQVRCGKIDEQ